MEQGRNCCAAVPRTKGNDDGQDDAVVLDRSRDAWTPEMSRAQQTGAKATAPLIRVIDADRATLDLLHEWLDSAGFEVVSGGEADTAVHSPAVLTIVDVPFTRHGGQQVIQRVAAQYPGVPILALSPTFFSNVKCGGNCARALGVAGVLPKPIAHDALIDAIRDLTRPRE
jgi:FixJ family two-component response regulator